jgi:hypothetical protein
MTVVQTTFAVLHFFLAFYPLSFFDIICGVPAKHPIRRYQNDPQSPLISFLYAFGLNMTPKHVVSPSLNRFLDLQRT